MCPVEVDAFVDVAEVVGDDGEVVAVADVHADAGGVDDDVSFDGGVGRAFDADGDGCFVDGVVADGAVAWSDAVKGDVEAGGGA